MQLSQSEIAADFQLIIQVVGEAMIRYKDAVPISEALGRIGFACGALEGPEPAGLTTGEGPMTHPPSPLPTGAANNGE